MYIRLVLLLFILNSCDFPERDCLKFKTGTFEFKSISEEGDTLITKFTRTKDLEIGYFNGKIDSNSVKWVSDCECIYKKVNPKSLSEKKSVQMKILSTNENSYTFEYSFVVKLKTNKEDLLKKLKTKTQVLFGLCQK